MFDDWIFVTVFCYSDTLFLNKVSLKIPFEKLYLITSQKNPREKPMLVLKNNYTESIS